MWMLGFAIVAIVAAIALLLRLYVKLSAQEDLPAADSPEAPRRPRLAVPLDLASLRRDRLRTLAERAAPGENPVVMLVSDFPEAAIPATPADCAADRPVPVLEIVPAGCPSEHRPAPAPHDGGAAPAGSVRFG